MTKTKITAIAWLKNVSKATYKVSQIIIPTAALIAGVAGILGCLGIEKLTSILLMVLSLEFFFTLLTKNKIDSDLGKALSFTSQDSFFTHENPKEKEIVENAAKELFFLQETGDRISEDYKAPIKEFLEIGGTLKIVICSSDKYTVSQLLLRNDNIPTYEEMKGRFNLFIGRLNEISKKDERHFTEKISIRFCPYPISLTAAINDKKEACVRMADFKVPYEQKNDLYIDGTKNPILHDFYYEQFKKYYLHSYKIILLTSKPNVDKTAIFKELLEDSENDFDNIYNSDYIFSIFFEKIYNERKEPIDFNVSISDIRGQKQSINKCRHNEDALNEVAEKIKKNKNKILIIDEIGLIQMESKKIYETIDGLFKDESVTLFATISQDEGDRINHFRKDNRAYCMEYKNKSQYSSILDELTKELSASLNMYKILDLGRE